MTAGPEQPLGLDLIWLRPERTARDRRPALSRAEIVRTAIEIADEQGLEAMSTRGIAARLGSSPTSLYWHVPSKADLHELVFDAVMGEIELPEPPCGDWREDLRALALRTHAMLGRHPWLVLLGIQPGIGPNCRRYAEFATRVVAGLGLDADTVTQVMAMVNNYLTGFAHRKTAWDQLTRRAGLDQLQWDERLGHYLTQTQQHDPVLAQYVRTRVRLTGDPSLELGLDCMLDGIAVHFAMPQAQADGHGSQPAMPGKAPTERKSRTRGS